MRYAILLFASVSVIIAKRGDSFDSNSNELYGRKGHGGKHGGPPFLVNVTQAGRAAYFRLIENKNKNQTKGEIKSAVDAWATTYNVSADVTSFENEMETLKSERRANVTTAVGELPEAISALNAIEDDQNITSAETSAQIREAIQAMSPELRDLVLAAQGGIGEKGWKGGKKGKGWKGGMNSMGRFGNGQVRGHGRF